MNKAFTIIELIVTVSIVAVIMSVILFGYSSFNDRLTSTSAVQEVSLAIRQAQTYGLSVKEGTAGDYSKGYGISFSTIDTTNYYLFIDNNGNGKNDNTGTCIGECIQKIAFQNGVRIGLICGAVLTNGGLVCPAGSGVVSMSITFVRPNPDSNIRFFNNSGVQVGSNFERGQVVLRSPKGLTNSVTIEKTGQIYVK